jgi:uncharacterized protein YraI
VQKPAFRAFQKAIWANSCHIWPPRSPTAGGICRLIGPRDGEGNRFDKKADGRSTDKVKRGECRVIGSYWRKATAWSPVDTLIAGEPVAAAPRRGPSLMFAVAVIGGVAVLTGTAVALFFPQASQSAADPAPAIAAADEEPVLTASLDPVFPPVRKVVTKSYPALKTNELPAPKPVKITTVKPGAATADGKPAPAAPAPQSYTGTVASQPAAEAARGDRATVEVASAGEADALQPQDPRWARSGAEDAKTDFVAVIPPAAGGDGKAAQDNATGGDPADATRTAAISPEDVKPKKVAKSAKQTDDTDDASADDTPVAPGVSGATRPAQVNKGVNMRSRGRSGASVVMTIPASAVVQVVGCKAWCEIIYKGQRGYIYKDFLGGGSKRIAAKKSRSKVKVAATQPATSDTKTVYVVDSVKTDATQTDTTKTDTTKTGTTDQGQQRKITSQHAQ